jgi:hypothetical protein
LPREQVIMLHIMLSPFKLLVLRSAQSVPRLARGSSFRRIPKDMLRLVREMM